MDPRTPTLIADVWLYQTLIADRDIQAFVGNPDGTFRVFTGQAPELTPYPLIVIQDMGGSALTAMGGWRTMVTLRKKIGVADITGSLVAIDPIVDRIDQLLQTTAGAPPQGGLFPAGGYINSCVLVLQQQLSNPDEGREYREMASVYQLEVIDRP